MINVIVGLVIVLGLILLLRNTSNRISKEDKNFNNDFLYIESKLYELEEERDSLKIENDILQVQVRELEIKRDELLVEKDILIKDINDLKKSINEMYREE